MLVLAAVALTAGPLRAQAPQPLEIPRLRGAVALDGGVDEAAWEGVAPLPMTLHQPTFEGTPTERTEVRVGAWDVGLLDMQTAATGGLASENMGVLRLRRQLLNANSYAGGIVTSRLGTDGRHNRAYGLDGSLRLFGDDYLAFAWAQTSDSERPGASPLAAARMYATWDRRTQRGLGYSLGFSRSGADYLPGLGFEGRHDEGRNRARAGGRHRLRGSARPLPDRLQHPHPRGPLHLPHGQRLLRRAQRREAADERGRRGGLLLRRVARRGAALAHLVYNEGVNTDLYRASPALPRSGSRALLLKYSRTFMPSLFR